MLPGSVEVKFEHQYLVANQILHSVEELRRVGKDRISRQRIETRLTGLREDWDEFVGNHKSLVSEIAELDGDVRIEAKSNEYFTTNVFKTTRESFLESFERMSTLLDNIQDGSSSVDSARGASLSQPVIPGNHRLPRLELPKFDGDYTEWLTFRDMFSSLVLHNSSLSSIEKLQYLKTSLSGSAALFLKNTALTSDNFQRCWNDLIAYYDNKRILVDSNLHALFSIKRIQTESAAELEGLYTTVQQAMRSLDMLGQPVKHWDSILIYLTTRCLDPDTIKAWELHLGSSTEYPKWDQLSQFLVSRMRSLLSIERASPSYPTPSLQSSSKPPRPFSGTRQWKSHSVQQSTPFIKGCPICRDDHPPWSCPVLRSKPVPRRIDLIKEKGLCYNCLGDHHLPQCPSTRRCFKCGKKHHTVIHSDELNSKPRNPLSSTSLHVTSEDDNKSPSAQVLHTAPTAYLARSSVLLATALAKIEIYPEYLVDVRLLIDPCSEISLVSERFVNMHHLPRQKSYLSIVGAGAIQTGRSKGTVTLKLKSNLDPNFSCHISAEIIPKVTGNIPSIKPTNSSWNHLQDIELADPQFYYPSAVDILLGVEAYSQIIQNDLKKGKPGEPIAQLTSLGWIISGPSHQNTAPISANNFHCSGERDWYDLIERFWRQEEVSDKKPSSTPSDQECETHFISTHTRTESGRYMVRIPFKSPLIKLGNSKSIALKMLNRLDRRFDSDHQYFQRYDHFIQEYIDLGHMKLVTPSSIDPPMCHYLPHHSVPHHSGLESKIRVVFNGSSKSDNGVALNDVVHTGAKLQIDLIDVMMRFRRFRYVFSTDIEKMYRQIAVHPDDWNYQRILWKDTLGRILTYSLTTISYGLACAPFLALRTMMQLVQDEGDKFPLAVPVLTKGRYVDDIFGGDDSIGEVQQVVDQVRNICEARQFPLRKWVSNHPAVLCHIPPEHQLPLNSVVIDPPSSISTLGLAWRPSEDVFHFSISISSQSPLTKRIISFQIARLFDPMGLIAPVTIRAKMLLQKLWALGIGWDDPVPQSVLETWSEFIHQLTDLKNLTIPRWIGVTRTSKLEIHGFSDASQVGIAAVVYVRTSDNDNVRVSLVCAKTKVSPLKRVTIPRLELTAASLLTRLTSHVYKTLELTNTPICLWTDSSIVHTWVTNHPSKWKDYVHNRVCLIQETLPQAKWKLIPGPENPADCASRGLTPDELSHHPIWWTGPSWLTLESTEWPGATPSAPPNDRLEIRYQVSSLVVTPPVPVWDLLTRYSNLTRLLRITAICQRAVKKFRHQFTGSILVPLTPEELLEAKYYWVRQTQMHDFKIELDLLTTEKTLPKQNPLIRLTPFTDASRILRVGGRLQNAEMSYDNKHPFILSRHCPLSNLIISDAHSKTLHGSTQTTLAFIRTTCWILGGRAPIKSFILRCVKCSILRRKNAQQLMGQLPSSRVTKVPRPFIHTGVDYAGPFNLKKWSGRAVGTYKSYIALFVCLTTSAIHLEIVTDYSTEAFLAAYRRFTSRRGICETLSSDCGTNLRGADSALKQLFSKASSDLGKLASLIANDGTKWQFNPPAAPHFGGKWEAGVKSVKFHLRRTIGDARITYEEMSTLLAQIEAVLNSRPMIPLTDDPDDLSVLTPGHFLIGQPINVIPEPSVSEVRINRLSRWQRLQSMMESFWTKWSRECLQRLQSVYKWNQPLESIAIGQLVLIIDERYPPTKWPLGRVLQVFPGKDGLVRVASVKTQHSTLTRPIVKLCPLPIPV